MICDRCHTREAVVHLTQIADGQSTTRHFCPECARAHGAAVTVVPAKRLTGTPMGRRLELTFAALVVTQTAHSIEEYLGRLWESFPPAAFLTGLVSSDRERGFLVLNVALVAFGVWCLLWPVWRRWPSAPAFVWIWIGISIVNGIGHPAWSLRQGSYTPGVLTAPILLALALYLVLQLRSGRRFVSPGERMIGTDE